ncbi:Protein of unknown function [Pyronema omphalodes CBS 100304]|uniref:Uncharacterized protein n=1 Tax=Pyronema omphalodes (strain CBS 100304) TaxID=1076935 RepID=U4LCS7_PYROM|nr:Protein of unknown function [Pyronema omphalodes CBS 100304]
MSHSILSIRLLQFPPIFPDWYVRLHTQPSGVRSLGCHRQVLYDLRRGPMGMLMEPFHSQLHLANHLDTGEYGPATTSRHISSPSMELQRHR